MSNRPKDSDHVLPAFGAAAGSEEIVILEECVEIQHTKAYGIGIDCHSKFIQVSVLVKRDLRVFEYRREFSTSWNALLEACSWAKSILRNYSSPPVDESSPFHYCIESTSTYHLPVILSWGGVPSIVNPSIAGSTKRKTDVLDAKLLAIHDLTGIWRESFLPSSDVQQLRVLIGERNQYSKTATRISNRIGTSLLKFGYTIGSEGSVSRRSTTRTIIENQISDSPDTDFSGLPPEGIPADVRCAFRKDYELYDQFTLLANEYAKKSISKAESMEWQFGTGTLPGSDVIAKLITAPYIGEWTAVVWLSIIVTTDRFPNDKALAAYCGLDPSLKISAKHVTSTVKRGGNKDLHNALTRAASNLIRIHNEPFGQWGYNLYQQSGRWKKAANAVARKLAVALYYMQKRGEPFSYENYGIAHAPEVIDMTLSDLAVINPSFRRYLNLLVLQGITGTRQLVERYTDCSLSGTRGLGKKFSSLLREFIDNQEAYSRRYEILQGREAATQ